MGKKKNHLVWGYFAFLGFVVIPFLGYCFYHYAPIPPDTMPLLPVFAALIWAFWMLRIDFPLGVISVPIEMTPSFLLPLLFIKGPSTAFLSFFVGTSVFALFFLPRPPRAKAATAIIGTASYGLAFFLLVVLRHFFFIDFTQPYWIFSMMWAILLVQTIIHVPVLGSWYLAIAQGKRYKDAHRSQMPHLRAFFFTANFPGLAFIAYILWQSGFYVVALLLVSPFLLFRMALESSTRAVYEIANSIETLVTVVEAKDPYTHHHCNRVALYAEVIARFCGLPDSKIEKIRRAARLHDVGKINVPDKVLKKEGGLSGAEYDQIKLHTDPHKILMKRIPDEIPMKELFEIGRHHHERFDGKGYPDQWAGEEIPIEVRVISMADAWDAMTSNRAYRKALSDEAALAEVEKYKGKQWDPLVVEALQEAHEQGAIQAVRDNPDILKNPPKSWVIKPKPLVDKSEPFLQKKPERMRFKPTKRLIAAPAVAALCFFVLYFLKATPLHQIPFVLFAGFAGILEILEMKFPKRHRYSPVDAIYLASLLVTPWPWVLLLIVIGAAVRTIAQTGFAPWQMETSRVFELGRRLVFFAATVPYLIWAGFGQGGRLFVWRNLFENPLNLIYFLSLWAFLFCLANFISINIGTMVTEKIGIVSWPLRTFGYSLFFEIGVVVPLACLLLAFTVVNPVYFPYLLGSFSVVLLLAYPLIDHLRGVVEGNVTTLNALSDFVDERIPCFKGRSKRVSRLAKKIAKAAGLSEEQLESLQFAGRIIGFGNLGIPDKILSKEGSLNDLEMAQIREWSKTNARIMSQYPFYREEMPVIRRTRERCDKKSRLFRLLNRAILRLAGALTIADAYDAMTSSRPYRQKPMTREEAVAEIIANKGTQFDPLDVQAFLRILPTFTDKDV